MKKLYDAKPWTEKDKIFKRIIIRNRAIRMLCKANERDMERLMRKEGLKVPNEK